MGQAWLTYTNVMRKLTVGVEVDSTISCRMWGWYGTREVTCKRRDEAEEGAYTNLASWSQEFEV